MNVALWFVLVAILIALLFVGLAKRHAKEVADTTQAAAIIQTLDIEAFRNLVDPQEDAFLHASLPPREFRRLKRERAQVARAYVKALSHASLQLSRLGDAARRSPDPVVAASGKQLANSATYLRLLALEANVRLTVSATFPRLNPRPLRSLFDRYDRATHLLQNHHGLTRARGSAS